MKNHAIHLLFLHAFFYMEAANGMGGITITYMAFLLEPTGLFSTFRGAKATRNNT